MLKYDPELCVIILVCQVTCKAQGILNWQKWQKEKTEHHLVLFYFFIYFIVYLYAAHAYVVPYTKVIIMTPVCTCVEVLRLDSATGMSLHIVKSKILIYASMY